MVTEKWPAQFPGSLQCILDVILALDVLLALQLLLRWEYNNIWIWPILMMTCVPLLCFEQFDLDYWFYKSLNRLFQAMFNIIFINVIMLFNNLPLNSQADPHKDRHAIYIVLTCCTSIFKNALVFLMFRPTYSPWLLPIVPCGTLMECHIIRMVLLSMMITCQTVHRPAASSEEPGWGIAYRYWEALTQSPLVGISKIDDMSLEILLLYQNVISRT